MLSKINREDLENFKTLIVLLTGFITTILIYLYFPVLLRQSIDNDSYYSNNFINCNITTNLCNDYINEQCVDNDYTLCDDDLDCKTIRPQYSILIFLLPFIILIIIFIIVYSIKKINNNLDYDQEINLKITIIIVLSTLILVLTYIYFPKILQNIINDDDAYYINNFVNCNKTINACNNYEPNNCGDYTLCDDDLDCKTIRGEFIMLIIISPMFSYLLIFIIGYLIKFLIVLKK